MRVKYEIIFRCNGSVILAPSPWEGETTPNINGEERFLRGGVDSVQLETEEDSLQSHTHDISDSGHQYGNFDKYTQNNYNHGGNGYYGSAGEDIIGDQHRHSTLPTAEILSGKNARAWVSMVLYSKN